MISTCRKTTEALMSAGEQQLARERITKAFRDLYNQNKDHRDDVWKAVETITDDVLAEWKSDADRLMILAIATAMVITTPYLQLRPCEGADQTIEHMTGLIRHAVAKAQK
jgi:hypothetical protein